MTHLQQQDELREALDGFDHQTVESDSVWTRGLFLLKVKHNQLATRSSLVWGLLGSVTIP